MMLVITVLRYRATVHPLKLAISRRKLKVVCGLVYIVGFIAGYGTDLPLCFMQQNDRAVMRILYAYAIIVYILVPIIFMTVVYYRIGRALVAQSKHMKRVCSNVVRRRHFRDRRTFLVCLSTVLCYAVGNLPISVWNIWFIVGEYNLLIKYVWTLHFGSILRIAGSHSANPLIYGIIDKKLLTFRKLCRKKRQFTNDNS
jgi:hypothetical protein